MDEGGIVLEGAGEGCGTQCRGRLRGVISCGWEGVRTVELLGEGC